jgi:hypothetical protein
MFEPHDLEKRVKRGWQLAVASQYPVVKQAMYF